MNFEASVALVMTCGAFAVVDGDAGVLIGISPGLCNDGIDLIRRVSSIDVTILKNDSNISKDKVSGAIDAAFFIELPLRMNEKGVLTLKSTSIEDREVRAGTQSNCLVIRHAGTVTESYVLSNESVTINS
ncbi:hypothetical protein NL676_009579 [Syzygium grande]|nr:hypothetical protein NL676_009579 [Syzygium grande]